MDILKYEVSVKNRLLPFVAAKEIADILNDIEDGSVQQEDVNAVFGNPKTLTGEIKKGKRKNFDYIVEIVLVLSIMIMTYIYPPFTILYSVLRNMSSFLLIKMYNHYMMIVFGTKLRECRHEAKMTQAQLATILNVSKTTICQWETHKQEPCLEDVVKLAHLFQVTTDYLLGVEESGI